MRLEGWPQAMSVPVGILRDGRAKMRGLLRMRAEVGFAPLAFAFAVCLCAAGGGGEISAENLRSEHVPDGADGERAR